MSDYCWTLFKKTQVIQRLGGPWETWVQITAATTKFPERRFQVSAVCNEMVHAIEYQFLSLYKWLWAMSPFLDDLRCLQRKAGGNQGWCFWGPSWKYPSMWPHVWTTESRPWYLHLEHQWLLLHLFEAGSTGRWFKGCPQPPSSETCCLLKLKSKLETNPCE